MTRINGRLISSDMPELTEKQKKVLNLLVRTARMSAPAPTFREIAREMKVDVRSAYQHIESLEKKGVLERTGGRRGIQLKGEFAPMPGLPVIGRVAAGLPILAEQNVDTYVDIRGLVVDEDAFLLKVKGDSMVDRHIFEGDLVLVKPRHRLEPGEIGVVVAGGEATVKEVHMMRDRIILTSHNRAKSYPDQVYAQAEGVRVIGKVIMAFRFVQ